MHSYNGPDATGSGEFRDGDPSQGIPATVLLAQWPNMIQRELLAVLTAADVTPDADTFDQVAAAARRITGLPGAAVSAAATLVVPNDGNVHTVSGSAAISAISDTAPSPLYLLFTGSGTITHGSALQLPGAANISRVNGDCATFVRIAGGWRCIQYTPANDLRRSEFAGGSMAANDWQAIPRASGAPMILQWGAITVGDLLLGSYWWTQSVTFPVTFPNACRRVFTGKQGDGAASVSGARSITASGFEGYMEEWGAVGQGPTNSFTWWAIGF